MKRAGEVLSVFFDERLMKKARGYSKLFASWADLTAKNGVAAAADHSRIRELDRGVLQIEADHPGWIQILQTKESRLLGDFRRRFPDLDISGISLMLSRAGPPEDAPAETPDPAGDSEPLQAESPVSEQTHSGYDNIKDETFRETLKRLGKSIAAKEKPPSLPAAEMPL